jgi:nucleoside-diphosphate-sugar epimerase
MVCINVALEHFYGPLDNSTNFVSSIVRQLLDGADSIDLTLGEQKRDFIYIDDIISAFLLIIDNSATLKSGYLDYEIGTGNTIAIREFVEMAKQLSGNNTTRLNFGAVPYRKNEAMQTAVNSAAIRALGWHPGVSLADGLSRMIAVERKARTI